MTQREKAETLRRLHTAPELLVLVNVWDAASARTVAAVPACRALATASWSIAAAHGLPDGEALSRDAMLGAVERVAAAVELPVSADLERGYGATAIEVEETVTAAIAAGAVGCNLEDSVDDEARPLRPAAEHADRVAAARAAGERSGVPLVINARTDVFLVGGELEEAIERGRAYAIAGADCIFVPGAPDAATIERLVAGIGAPVSIFAHPGGLSLAELERLGVARASVGPGTLGVAMAALARAAEALLAREPLPADLAFRPPAYPEIA
jgi:2-methylisocitrate lyase-like PEP mutase family enzyme